MIRERQERYFRCRKCDYSLRGLKAARCPECGTPFDPADRTTMNTTGGPISSALRLLLRPPLWIWWLSGAAMLLFQFWESRWPGGPDSQIAQGFVMAWELWFATFVALAAWRWLRIDPGIPRELWLGGMRRWQLVVPFIAGAVVIGATSLPWRFAVLLSAPGFTRLERQLLAAPPAVRSGPFWVGLFPISEAYHGGRYVAFDIARDGRFVATVVRPDQPVAKRFESDERPRTVIGSWVFSNRTIIGDRDSFIAADLLRHQLDDPSAPRVRLDTVLTVLANNRIGYGLGRTGTGTDCRTSTPRPGRDMDDALPSDRWRLRPDLLVFVQRFDEAIPVLIRGLQGGQPETQQQICHLIVRMDREVPALAADVISLLSSLTPGVRDAAAYALVCMPKTIQQNAPAVTQALNDSSPAVRYNIAVAIRKAHPPAVAAVPQFIKAIERARRSAAAVIPRYSDYLDPMWFSADWETDSIVLMLDALGDYDVQAAEAIPLLRELTANPRTLVSTDADDLQNRDLESVRQRRQRTIESALRQCLRRVEGRGSKDDAAPATPEAAPVPDFAIIDALPLQSADEAYAAAMAGKRLGAMQIAPFRAQLCELLQAHWKSFDAGRRSALRHLIRRLGPQALPMAEDLPHTSSCDWDADDATVELLRAWKSDWREGMLPLLTYHIPLEPDIEEMILSTAAWRKPYLEAVVAAGMGDSGPGHYGNKLVPCFTRMAALAPDDAHVLLPLLKAWSTEAASLTTRRRSIEALSAVKAIIETHRGASANPK